MADSSNYLLPPTLISPLNNSISVKLSDNNYLLWKQQVEAVVMGHGLEHHLADDQDIPLQFISEGENEKINPTFLSWRRQDQLLSAWIQASLSESIMVSVVGLHTCKDVWKALERNFSSRSKAKIMQYKLQL